MLTVKELAIPEVKLLTPKLHRDERGYLTEIMQEREMTELGLPRFVQENQSMSVYKNTVRGLHAQKPPAVQAKLVRVLRGKIFDVAVDARPDSRTFGQHVTSILSDEGNEFAQMYIPAGFLHGFCTLTDNTVVLYKMSNFYAPVGEVGVIWNDPDLGIAWPTVEADAIVSAKDAKLTRFKDMPRLAW